MDYHALLRSVASSVESYRGQGNVASYIPALAKADPGKFGIALALRDGSVFAAGDSHDEFSIQGISYVFALPLALQQAKGALWNHVGREPSGLPIHSIVQLHLEKGRPRNPLTSAGAIVACDQYIGTRRPEEASKEFLDFLRQRSGDPDVGIDEGLAMAESRAGAFNRSLAYFISAAGNLRNEVEDVLSVYYAQCSVKMNCRQLARSMLFFAFDGRDPETGEVVTSSTHARRTNALMMSAGHYDSSGEFAFRVGLPAKSAASGCIVAIIPRVGTVCVWSPPLNSGGSSLAGAIALERLVERTGWSVFA
jgi:glutaminase